MPAGSTPFDVIAWCRDELARVRDELRAAEGDPDCGPETIAGYRDIIAKLEALIARHSV
jgi:hypothetical protein